MFQRIAARPLVLTAALFLLPGCDDGGGDAPQTNIEGTSTGGGSSSTGEESTGEDATTGEDGSTSGSSGEAESSTGTPGGSSSGGEDTDSTGDVAIGYADLAGDYVEPYPGGMTLHTLSAEIWIVDYGTGPLEQSVVQIDDDARWVVLEDAGTYSRNDWTFDDEGVLRYCTGAYGAESAEAAVAAPMSDARDLDGTGCGGMFPWSTLEPVE